MTTNRLKLYNGALLICGARGLAALTDNVEGRHLLDTVWNDGAVDMCLSEGQWRFAMRTQKLDYDAGIAPTFGLRRGFQKSTDWLLTSAVCIDEYYNQPLLRYTDEAGVLFADLDTIYVKFVSNDSLYGGDLALWPPSFVEYVKHYLASRIVFKVSSDESRREYLLGPAGRPDKGAMWASLVNARNRDAISEPTRFPAQGSWIRSRRGRGTTSVRDGGNPNSLIG